VVLEGLRLEKVVEEFEDLPERRDDMTIEPLA
jgi:hypothetical protein